MVRLPGSCLGGRVKNRSWQATTTVPTRGERSEPRGSKLAARVFSREEVLEGSHGDSGAP